VTISPDTTADSRRAEPGGGALDRVFKLAAHGTSVRTEVAAGLTTFMVMAYIVFVNPVILGFVGVPALAGRGLPVAATATATALVAGVMTIAMGLYTNRAFAVASGLGLNAVVAFQLVAVQGLTPAEAMGVIVIEGFIILLLTQTNFREAIMLAIPLELKRAIAVGIGLFIAFIGFVNAGFVVPGAGTPVALATLTGLPILVAVFGLVVTILLRTAGERIHPVLARGYLLFGIVLTTIFATVVNESLGGTSFSTPGVALWPTDFTATPDFSTIGEFSLTGVFAKLGLVTALLVIFSIMLSDFFDTMGTLVGVGAKAGYLDERGAFKDVKRPLLVDSLAAMAGGAASASSATTYIESAAGVEAGGRTGLTSVVTGVCFLLMMFVAPLVGMVPAQATAPALILVGWMMMTSLAMTDDSQEGVSVRRSAIAFDNFEIGFPAAVTILLMPFTYSITNGIGAGLLLYTLIQLFVGKGRSVHPALYIVSAAFLIYFLDAWLRPLLT